MYYKKTINSESKYFNKQFFPRRISDNSLSFIHNTGMNFWIYRFGLSWFSSSKSYIANRLNTLLLESLKVNTIRIHYEEFDTIDKITLYNFK